MRAIVMTMALAALAAGALATLSRTADATTNQSGADAYRASVMQCLAAGLSTGRAQPVPLARQCIEAVQLVWAASYPTSGPPCHNP